MTTPKPKKKRKKITPLNEIVQTAKGLLDAGAATYRLIKKLRRK